jgi:hypothetical protein
MQLDQVKAQKCFADLQVALYFVSGSEHVQVVDESSGALKDVARGQQDRLLSDRTRRKRNARGQGT